jgi:hypothetical protein
VCVGVLLLCVLVHSRGRVLAALAREEVCRRRFFADGMWLVDLYIG